MGKVFGRVIVLVIIAALLVGFGAFGLYNCSANTPFESVRTNALNAAIDAMDLKGKLDSNLRARAQAIAQEYGLPSQILEGTVDMLDIEHWSVTNTPKDVAVRDTVDLNLDGTDLKVTTYEEPNVISIAADGNYSTYGQSITFSIPESAQGITDVLALYDDANESGVLDLATSIMGAAQ